MSMWLRRLNERQILWDRVCELENELRTKLTAKQHWAAAWKKAAKLQHDLAEHWFKSWLRTMLQLDYRVKELTEQRGRYDKLLAEHKALQALLEVLDERVHPSR